MSRLSLDNFIDPEDTQSEEQASSEAATDLKIEQAFEKGYNCGWEDSVAAQRSALKDSADSLSQELETLTRSFDDIRRDFQNQFSNIVINAVEKLLPELKQIGKREVFASILSEQVLRATASTLCVTCNPEDREILEQAATKYGELKDRLEISINDGKHSKIFLENENISIEFNDFFNQLGKDLEELSNLFHEGIEPQ